MESTVNCFKEVVENGFILPAVAPFFFLFLESLQFLSLKEIVFGSSKQALAKWLFNPVQAYSAITIEMQIKTKRRYHF